MLLDYPHFRHPAMERLAPVAEQFCAIIERHAGHDADGLLHQVLPLLPQLYALGLQLPQTNILFADTEEVEDDEDAENQIPEYVPDPDGGDADEWHRLHDGLTKQLGARCFYREVFDAYLPAEEQPEVTGSLADDLADIYRDLRTGLRKWNRGETGAALWEWRFRFESHWGEHATSALRAIHTLTAWHDLDWPVSAGEPVAEPDPSGRLA